MDKKLVGMVLAVVIAISALAGCKGTDVSVSEAVSASTGGKVGVALPAKEALRWYQDGLGIQAQLEDAGYEVDLRYASNEIEVQISQIEDMVDSGCSLLIVAPIDTYALDTVLGGAKEKGVPVISYDRLVMESDAVSYYVTFDTYSAGAKQGEYIRDRLGLEWAEGPFYMEVVAGAPEDDNARRYYYGAMDVLFPYINEGKLTVKSGQVEFEAAATEHWSIEAAQDRMDAILSEYYADGTQLSAVLCACDSLARGIGHSLETNYAGAWPVITGQDCEADSMKNMIAGKQSMSVFKDTHVLVSKVVEMVGAVMKGGEVPVNDTKTYDNGKGVVPAYLCESVSADINNYRELLLDSGYYIEADLQ